MTKSDLEISPKVSVFDPHPPSTHISDFVLPKKRSCFYRVPLDKLNTNYSRFKPCNSSDLALSIN